MCAFGGEVEVNRGFAIQRSGNHADHFAGNATEIDALLGQARFAGVGEQLLREFGRALNRCFGVG